VRLIRTDAGIKTLHATSAAPDLGDEQTAWFPLARATRLDVEPHWEQLSDNLVAGVPVQDDEVVVIGRRGGPEILDSELMRLAHLTALALTIHRS
jgi:hypothetical protein